MLIAKFGGSLIAPKSKVHFIDVKYLTQIAAIRNNINEDKFFIHGAGNIGHGFIKQYGLSNKTYITGRIELQQLNNAISSKIKGVRLSPHELQFVTIDTQGSFICGGDIVPDLTISSGDDQFPQLINQTQSKIGYIFTDVDGVLDQDNNLISEVSQTNIDQIKFWEVSNDVTGGMKSKIEKLIQQIDHPCTIWIANGHDFNNTKLLLGGKGGKGTKIVIS